MLDLNRIPPPPLLYAVAKKIGSYFNLDTLPLHIHEVIAAVIFYHTICLTVSPWISAKLFPNTYPKLTWRTKLNWDVHVVSLVQSTLISALALWIIFYDEERQHMDWKERVWGYTGAGGLVQALALGYFVWDLWLSTVHVDIFGFGLLAHAMSAFYVFSLGFRPFVNYYAPAFILFELSSPFLNFHWFFDKLEMTGSTPQFINGIFLMTSFFGSRLVWGNYLTYNVFKDVFKALDFQKTAAGSAWLSANAKYAQVATKAAAPVASQIMQYANGKQVPVWYAYTYLGSNIVLTVLNVFWFGKMIETIRKRFKPPFGTMRVEEEKKKEEKDEDEIVVGRGIEEDGTKTVEVDSKEVRRRKGATGSDLPPPQ